MVVQKPHWGDWVLKRSRLLGFRTQHELAKQIGCRPEQLSRWVQRADPPHQMRKGFDRILIRLLRTTRKMLFVDFAKTGPDAAPNIVIGPDGLFPDSKGTTFYIRPPETVLAKLIAEMEQWEIESMIGYATLILLATPGKRRSKAMKMLVDSGRAHLVGGGEREE